MSSWSLSPQPPSPSFAPVRFPVPLQDSTLYRDHFGFEDSEDWDPVSPTESAPSTPSASSTESASSAQSSSDEGEEGEDPDLSEPSPPRGYYDSAHQSLLRHSATMVQTRQQNSTAMPASRSSGTSVSWSARGRGPPSQREQAARRPRSAAIATVDLTSSPTALVASATTASSPALPARKRRRMGAHAPVISHTKDEDEVNDALGEDEDTGDRDDTDDTGDTDDTDDTDEGLKNRQIEAVEQSQPEKPKKLANVGCIICMEEEATDLSVTPCGHLFCHQCLHGAIKSTLAQNKAHGKCPVCRGKVAIKDIVVLEIRKMSKGKERAV